jgi:AraC-like DNA-binding protein
MQAYASDFPEQTGFRTRNLDHAQAYMANSLGQNKLHLDRGQGALNLAYQHASVSSPISIHRISFGAPVTVDVPPIETYFLFQLTLQGRCTIDSTAGSSSIEMGDIFVANPAQTFRKRWTADAQQLILKIDRQALEHHLARECPQSRLTMLEFETFPDQASDTTLLLDIMRVIWAESSRQPSSLHKTSVSRHLAETLFSLLLYSLPHNKRSALDGTASPAIPHQVRRAEEYIRQHIREDLTLREIAEAAGVSPRSLTTGFRRFRDDTPMSFVRNLRLNKIRQALLEADPATDTVTNIALDFGIQHLSRFSHDYSRRFGEFPSTTLRERAK